MSKGIRPHPSPAAFSLSHDLKCCANGGGRSPRRGRGCGRPLDPAPEAARDEAGTWSALVINSGSSLGPEMMKEASILMETIKIQPSALGWPRIHFASDFI